MGGEWSDLSGPKKVTEMKKDCGGEGKKARKGAGLAMVARRIGNIGRTSRNL